MLFARAANPSKIPWPNPEVENLICNGIGLVLVLYDSQPLR